MYLPVLDCKRFIERDKVLGMPTRDEVVPGESVLVGLPEKVYHCHERRVRSVRKQNNRQSPVKGSQICVLGRDKSTEPGRPGIIRPGVSPEL